MLRWIFLALFPALLFGGLPEDENSRPVLTLAGKMGKGLAEGEPRFKLIERKGGGTSAYALVEQEGKVVGAMIPENSATSIVGEVSTFNMGRALGCGELFQPAVKVSLRRRGLESFRTIMVNAKYSGPREQNRVAILARIKKNPEALPCVYKHWGASKPSEYDIAVSNGLKQSDVIAKFLQASAAQPGTRAVTIRGASAPETDLARQLSNIFLVDALAGQWDRFSGGNLHTVATGDRVQFIALDNGGASINGGTRFLESFKKWVTRFDRGTAEKFLAMEKLATANTPFLEYVNWSDFCEATGLETDAQKAALKKRVTLLAPHVQAALEKKGGVFE